MTDDPLGLIIYETYLDRKVLYWKKHGLGNTTDKKEAHMYRKSEYDTLVAKGLAQGVRFERLSGKRSLLLCLQS